MAAIAFASRLRTLREVAGLSVDDLARASGLSRQVLYRYEAGEREPGWNAVQAIARALGCTTDALRSDEGQS